MIIKTNGFKMPNGDIHTFIPPSPTENERGGIKAKAKTTEALEVAFDEASERLYAAIPNTDKTLSETGVAADAKTTGDKIKDKLDRNQGIEHYGKSLIVGEDGLVVPGEVQSGGDGIAIINTMSGESPLVIPDSAERVNKRLELGGKTEQVQTSGKNLANANVYEQGYLTSVNAGDKVSLTQMQKSFTTNMEVSSMQGKNVSVSVRTKEKTGKKYVFTDETDTIITGVFDTGSNNYSEFKNITIPKNAKKLFFSVTYDAQENTELQVELGTTVTTYEPYTGGKPSPSPEYPQEIKNSGKWNEETQKYEVDVKITGKNLFDSEKAKDKSKWTPCALSANFVEIAVYVGTGSTVTASNNVKIDNPVYYYGVALKSSEDIKYFICYPGYPNSKDTHTFTATEDYIYVRCNKTSLNDVIGVCGGLQIEIGASRTDFESYKEQTLTLTSDRPITKWDRLVEQDGQIGWLYKSKIIDGFDGQSSNITLGGKQGKVQHFSVVFADTPNGNGNGDIYVDRYRAIAMSYTKAEFGICCNWNSGVKFFSAPNENVTTVQEFKTWLAENPLVLVYETISTEFIPLPQSEQNAIRALKTYYPTTTITNDQGCTMELDYVADTKNYIDNKFAQLQKSLINTNTQLL